MSRPSRYSSEWISFVFSKQWPSPDQPLQFPTYLPSPDIDRQLQLFADATDPQNDKIIWAEIWDVILECYFVLNFEDDALGGYLHQEVASGPLPTIKLFSYGPRDVKTHAFLTIRWYPAGANFDASLLDLQDTCAKNEFEDKRTYTIMQIGLRLWFGFYDGLKIMLMAGESENIHFVDDAQYIANQFGIFHYRYYGRE